MDAGVGLFLSFIGFILVLTILIGGAGAYKEKFERNFMFNGCAWGILFADIMLIVGLGMLSEEPSASGNDLAILIFVVPGASLFFYFGLLVLFMVLRTNIKSSTMGWGIWQTIVQLIFVTLFSVIIVFGALWAQQKVGEVLQKK